MNDAALMGVVDGLADPADQFGGFAGGERSVCQAPGEALAR
jgi:hypothetical protein